jgi:NADH-quinone oxidoreductase subunit H
MMMACPMLEDEMIYNLTADPEEKRIFLLENKNTETLIPKLKDRVQQIVLAVIAIGLILTGLIFVIPAVNAAIIGVFWFLLKVSTIVYLLIWFRGTFPRFRYDQLMNIGWKIAIPIGMGAVLINALIGVATK